MSPPSAQVEQAVAWFLDTIGEAPDETLNSYLISVLTEPPCFDMTEMREIVCTFNYEFDQLPGSKQRDLLQTLVKNVRLKVTRVKT